MVVKMECQAAGGGDNYAESQFVTVPTSANPTFTVVEEPKAIWMIGIGNTGLSRVWTNVNPTTGEINNNVIYGMESSGSAGANWIVWTGYSFTFNKQNSVVECSGPMFGVPASACIFYTY